MTTQQMTQAEAFQEDYDCYLERHGQGDCKLPLLSKEQYLGLIPIASELSALELPSDGVKHLLDDVLGVAELPSLTKAQ